MKKVFFTVLLVLLFTGLTAYAQDSLDDSKSWSYQTLNNGVEVTAYHGAQTDVFVPSSIKVGGENLSVLKLGDGIFADNDSLNSVTLGEGITEIGSSAFEGCDNLVCIVTVESLTAIGEMPLKTALLSIR